MVITARSLDMEFRADMIRAIIWAKDRKTILFDQYPTYNDPVKRLSSPKRGSGTIKQAVSKIRSLINVVKIALLVVFLGSLLGCSSSSPKQTNIDPTMRRRGDLAVAESMRDAQQDNAIYQSQRSLTRQSNLAKTQSTGKPLFSGHIGRISRNAGGATLIHLSGVASPTFNRRQNTMVHVFRNGKPMGTYPMQVVQYGEKTVMGPLGTTVDVRSGDTVKIYPKSDSR